MGLFRKKICNKIGQKILLQSWDGKVKPTAHTEVYGPNGKPDYDTEVVLKGGKKVKINFKEYFTFTPTYSTKKEIIQEADNYYQAAAAAFKKVDHLAEINALM